MNKENIELLHENLKYLGFGENTWLNEELEQTLAQDPPEFQLFTEVFYQENCKLEAALHFQRSGNSGWYYFNYYEALLRIDGEPEKDRQQIFYINRGSGITLKEAFNLLQGRSVYKKKLVDKEEREYNAWVQLNFQEKNEKNNNYVVQQFGPGYGYDLEKTLQRYPIRELKFPDQKASLVRSLQRGNLQLVNFEKTKGIEKMYIAANPQYKTIYLFSRPLTAMQRTGKQREGAGIEDDGLLVSEPEGEAGGQDETAGLDKETAISESPGTDETAEPDKKKSPDTDTGSEEEDGPDKQPKMRRSPVARSLARKGERKLN